MKNVSTDPKTDFEKTTKNEIKQLKKICKENVKSLAMLREEIVKLSSQVEKDHKRVEKRRIKAKTEYIDKNSE